ncbi:tripartite tricarboxylate transporter substrate binding protein [Roseomonas sp. PWR1]|uniref:Tripartite tricarboxylate transporter substrate binding protein n=1 Tax=Roseomonas nitratireducens TaxID=2820810 RepID=A0ABS4ATS2_9PROT|nr:tripartite tricarboxylate transporter substrate binding protein [Neoroseomonas nitratireducens]MBP0463962.1 tripartite tricarboxylate transporter substrate binding protein [Neoroseomonas nitratireducens]
MMNRRTLLGAAGALLAAPAVAQSGFPTRSIRLIVPWPPGGSTDGQLRALAEVATRHLGQPVIIENRGGAAGTMAAQMMAAEQRGDGYLVGQLPVTAFRYPMMSSRPTWDPMRDFTYIIHLTGYLFGVVVKADSPWQTWQQFLDYAKANPGKVAYGSPGIGSTLHITMERIGAERGIEFLHVPFRGGADNAQSLLSGQTQAMADSTSWAPLVDGGQFRLLVTWGAERAKRYPNVPTLRETGIDIVSASPYGLAGPKGIDPGIVRVLHDAFKAALHDPAHLAVLERFDMPVVYMNSDDYRSAVQRTIEEEGAVIRRLNLRLN